MKLAIISHTEHYRTAEGRVVGWGPTVTEINHLSPMFDTIYHLAFLHETKAPMSSLPYTESNIIFIPLPISGGKTWGGKLSILSRMPKTLRIIHETLNKVDVFQLRTPWGIGVYLIPYLTLFSTKKGWYKYAGNWVQKTPPLGYALQRWMLKTQHRNVTINGKWPKQPKHCLTFENPCLTDKDRMEGQTTISNKFYPEKRDYCFVGTLDRNKGCMLILDALEGLEDLSPFGKLHIVGEGPLRRAMEEKAKRLNITIQFYGGLSKDGVIEIYKGSHFIVLPSQNEGFPKVIAEAMNYGCVPLVSDVSCLGQYIKTGNNGFLIEPVNMPEVRRAIVQSLALSQRDFNNYIFYNFKIAENFTYPSYNQRIKTDILNNGNNV